LPKFKAWKQRQKKIKGCTGYYFFFRLVHFLQCTYHPLVPIAQWYCHLTPLFWPKRLIYCNFQFKYVKAPQAGAFLCRKASYKLTIAAYLLPYFFSSFTVRIIIAKRKSNMDSRLMPCMYLSHCVRGALGSFFLRYKYSATCLNIPISANFSLKINKQKAIFVTTSI
jgi:hypothetical protein